MGTVIAIDGPSASGKSTTARLVAERLGFVHLDTGAMYRAVTLAAMRGDVSPEDSDGMRALLRGIDIRFEASGDGGQKVLLNSEDISEAIRTPEVTSQVSAYSAVPVVREKMVDLQRSVGESDDVVCEGRDIGTKVFPGAEYKFYLVADPAIRAKRRQLELRAQGHESDLEALKADLVRRDELDSTREISPLRKADDAVEVDTSNLTIEDQVSFILEFIHAGKAPAVGS